MSYQDDQRERDYRSALKAKVAEKRLIVTCTTGHYLARAALAMLQTGETWRREEAA